MLNIKCGGSRTMVGIFCDVRNTSLSTRFSQSRNALSDVQNYISNYFAIPSELDIAVFDCTKSKVRNVHTLAIFPYLTSVSHHVPLQGQLTAILLTTHTPPIGQQTEAAE